LATLALEEVGKAALLTAREVGRWSEKDDGFSDAWFDDHVKKLFWAFWSGPLFRAEKLTKDGVLNAQFMASRIHELRVNALYVDPKAPSSPRERVTLEDAERLLRLAEARIQLEQSLKIASIDDSNVDNIRWFLRASDDPRKRPLIFGAAAWKKLEELESGADWVQWLREQFDMADRENLAFSKAELTRPEPTEDEKRQPKWRLRIRIQTPSHSIRPRALNKWNELGSFIKLFPGKGKHELICEFTLDKNVPIAGIWWAGWGLSRAFVTALNVATRGFFWWNVPVDLEKYYEDLWDLEHRCVVTVERSPRLSLDWKSLRWVLREDDIPVIARMFAYLTKQSRTKGDERGPLDRYVGGLQFLAKTDIHLELQVNAFEEFFHAFKEALRSNKHWDGHEDLKEAAKRQLSQLLKSTADLEEAVELGIDLDRDKASGKKITLTEVAGMKLFCDLYFMKCADILVTSKPDGE